MDPFITVHRFEIDHNGNPYTWPWVVGINHIAAYSNKSIMLDNSDKTYAITESAATIMWLILKKQRWE